MTPLIGTISVSQCKIGLMFLWNQLDIDDTKSSLYGVTFSILIVFINASSRRTLLLNAIRTIRLI